MNKSAKMIYAIRILTIQYCTSSSVFVSEWVNDRKWVWEAQKILKNYANIATFQSDRVQVRRVQRNIIKSKAWRLNFCILNSFNNFFVQIWLIFFFSLSLTREISALIIITWEDSVCSWGGNGKSKSSGSCPLMTNLYRNMFLLLPITITIWNDSCPPPQKRLLAIFFSLYIITRWRIIVIAWINLLFSFLTYVMWYH